ncbi:hypothetical protein [Archaeoglobus sp.]
MKFELSGEVVEILKKSVWRSGTAKTPVISLPREYIGDKEGVQLIVVKKNDGSFAFVIQ